MEFNRLKDLGAWNIYFATKLLLYFQAITAFQLFENIGLALLLLLKINSAVLAKLRTITAIIIALYLAFAESGLISLGFDEVFQGQLINPSWLITIILSTALVTFIYFYSIRYIEISFFVLAGIVFAGLQQSGLSVFSTTNQAIPVAQETDHATPVKNLDETLRHRVDQFFLNEQQRQLPNILNAQTNFDIVFLSICSMAWQDLKLTGLDQHSLLSQFDIYFDQFNSATSYSGPALIRLLRADCGQPPHKALFDDQGFEQCEIFNNLQDLGYQQNLAMNHDGIFGGFLEQLRRHGGVSAALDSQLNLPIAQKSFDGTPIYDDAAVLFRWLNKRENLKPAAPQLLLYNTVSLHDGNRLVNQKNISGTPGYKFRAERLLDQLQLFINKLESSNRKTLLVLIPEHGASLKGDRMQFAGMREIPSPSITHVPVAVKLIGVNRHDAPSHISQEASFFALSSLIRVIIANNSFSNDSFSAATLTQNLPTIDHLAQNEGSTVIGTEQGFFVSLDENKSWVPYPSQ